MPRLPVLFAATAVIVLVAGLIGSRFGFSTGMTLTLPRNTYLISYHLLCFGAASCLCLFAFLYSIWMVPWSASAAWWHFGLSVALLALFCGATVAMESSKPPYGSSPAAMTLLLAFTVSPLLFAFVQGLFVLDGFRRCLSLIRR